MNSTDGVVLDIVFVRSPPPSDVHCRTLVSVDDSEWTLCTLHSCFCHGIAQCLARISLSCTYGTIVCTIFASIQLSISLLNKYLR